MVRSLVVVFAFVFTSPVAFSQNLITGTFNLRYDNPGDSGNLWKNRAPVCAALIRFHQFDILGTQEGLTNQLQDLQALLPEYTWFGAGRDDGKSKGEYSAIFYKKDMFNVKDSGNFWLSEHPEKPGRAPVVGCATQPHLFMVETATQKNEEDILCVQCAL